MLVLVLLVLWLAAAVVADLRMHRIPNLLSFGGAAAGLAFGLLAGWGGLLAALFGLVTGLGLFLPFYATGVMGAGDVKLLAAAGAFLGPVGAVNATLYTLIAGGVFGLAVLIWRDGPRETFGRYYFGIRHFLASRSWLGARAPGEDGRPLRFPYALAIATGVLLALWVPVLGAGGLVAWAG